MSPLPPEKEYPTYTNQTATFESIEANFLNKDLLPQEIATSVVGSEEVAQRVLTALGIQLNFEHAHVITKFVKQVPGLGAREFREIATNRPDIYIEQQRKFVTAKNIEEISWGFTALYKLGSEHNRIYRHRHGLPKVSHP